MSKNICDHDSEVNPQTINPLPDMPKTTRGCPNAILRSALFGIVAQGQKRVTVRNVEISSYTGAKIYYSGDQLNQNDLDLWLELLHLSCLKGGVGHSLFFSARGMLKNLGITSTNGRAIERLKLSLDRLKFAMVRIETKGWIFGDGAHGRNFLEKYDFADGQIRVVVDAEVAKMFEGTSWTQIELANRRRLKGQLALWLHGFYLTHEQPIYKLLVSTLHAHSGSKSSLKDFRQMLNKAAKELTSLGWEIEIKDSKVSVRRPIHQYEISETVEGSATEVAANPLPVKHLPATPKKIPKHAAWKEAEIQLARQQRARVAL